MSSRYVVGIDEVGRGPVAGPLLVAAVIVRQTPNAKSQVARILQGIRDSKKLNKKQREEWFIRFKNAHSDGVLDWRVSFVTASVIDRKGIAHAARVCVQRVLAHLACAPEETQVLLDGGLTAPPSFIYQKTIVRGDERRPLIAAASIVAKVSRDRRMQKYGERFPEYGFDTHKGYGTKKHFCAIQQYGTCILHRKTFIS